MKKASFRKILSFSLALILALSVSIPAFAATTGPTDITGETNQADITALYDYGALNGLLDKDGKFKPAEPCTHDFFATMLQNLYSNRNVVQSSWYGTEVVTQNWATSTLRSLSEKLGYRVSWSGGAPSATINRADAAGYIMAMLNCEPNLKKLITGNVPASTTPPPSATPTPDYGYDYSNAYVGNFQDVRYSDYFADPVVWALNKGITGGTSATTFSPNDVCTIAQVLTFLWRANGAPAPSSYTKCPFSNVSSDSYFYNACRWAKQKGLIVDDKIDPATTACTRAYVTWCLWKLQGSPYCSSSYSDKYTDIPANATYKDAFSWAIKNGISKGTSATTVSPMDQVNRAGVVTFLYRTYGPYGV